jgi:hypothetical protein
MLEVRECANWPNARPAQFASPEREAQKAALLDLRHLALVLVDRQLEPPAEVGGQTGFDALARPNAFDQHQQVIGIPCKTVPPSFQFPVQIVEQDVGQQRQEHATYTRDNLEFERQISLVGSESVLELRRNRKYAWWYARW